MSTFWLVYMTFCACAMIVLGFATDKPLAISCGLLLLALQVAKVTVTK
jgi:hypothetical protein